MYVLDTKSLVADDSQWDDFLAYVSKLLEEHPIARADSIVALRLGTSVYQHYENWQYNPMNMVKSHPEKVCYLLNYWKQKNDLTSMRAIVMALDEKLKLESSFNMMRGKIKKRYL